jgi:hypothetical protein
MYKNDAIMHARLKAHATGKTQKLYSRKTPSAVKGSPRDYRFGTDYPDGEGWTYHQDISPAPKSKYPPKRTIADITSPGHS